MSHKVELPEETLAEVYDPNKSEKKLEEFLSKRVEELKEFRKAKLPNSYRSIEDIWREADKEYTPHELSFSRGKTHFAEDEETGLSCRVVKVGINDGWQSNMASPDFYVKVNTALAILVDMNPEAVFMPTSGKYQKNTDIAYGNWKNSWEVSGAKQQVKNFVFNMSRYGTGVARTYPKLIEMEKSIRTEYFKDQPEKNKYEKHRLIKFNDLCRESINPWQVWLSELARPGDYNSMDDWYFEQDFSWDRFQETFKDSPNLASVPRGSHQKTEADDGSSSESIVENTIPVGFYENQVLDIYAVWIPSVKIMLYHAPLQNDDGMMSVWYAPWTLRDDRCPWGIGLYEIMRQDSILFDRINNMTVDQLTLSIYKMFFYKGSDLLGDNGQVIIGPGKGEQVSDPASIKFLEIPGPGMEAWKGLQYLQDRKDIISGVNSQLAGEFSGKTLGQDIQAKEAALERLKVPLDFLLDALQQEAYISISWQKQILSTPEILEYTDISDLTDALKEHGMNEEQVQKYLLEAQNPTQDNKLIFTDGEQNTEGQPNMYARVYKETSYSLDQDEKGELIESPDRRFYRFGLDLPTHRLDWRGIVRVKPQTVLAPSKGLEKRMKLDLFNLVYPAIQAMLAFPSAVPVLLHPIKQVLKTYEEKVSDWVDEKFFEQMAQQANQPSPEKPLEARASVTIKLEMLPQNVQDIILSKMLSQEIKTEQPLFISSSGGSTPLAANKIAPIAANKIAPIGNANSTFMAEQGRQSMMKNSMDQSL